MPIAYIVLFVILTPLVLMAVFGDTDFKMFRCLGLAIRFVWLSCVTLVEVLVVAIIFTVALLLIIGLAILRR